MKNQTGFTIIELMIAVTLGAILLAIALPNYQDMTKNNCLTADTNTLITHLLLTRSEAIKRKENVSIVAKGGNWGTGFEVKDSSGNILRDVSLSCTKTTVTESTGDTTFVYKPSGFIDTPGTFHVCDDRTGENGREIVINTVGRPNTNSDYTCL